MAGSVQSKTTFRAKRRHLTHRDARATAGRPPAYVLARVAMDASAEKSAKAALADKINALLDQHRLNQVAAAERLGIPQSKVSAIRNFKLRGVSLERLMQALIALDQQVEIVVRPAELQPSRSIAVL